MKAKMMIEKEVDIKDVLISVAPRYVGDDEDDDMPSSFYGLNESNTLWNITVDIDTGAIQGWPKGETGDVHIKVCDAGVYSLLDADGEEVAKIAGYVPHGVVPGSYGDYIEMKIDGNGVITNWPKAPDISDFEAE